MDYNLSVESDEHLKVCTGSYPSVLRKFLGKVLVQLCN